MNKRFMRIVLKEPEPASSKDIRQQVTGDAADRGPNNTAMVPKLLYSANAVLLAPDNQLVDRLLWGYLPTAPQTHIPGISNQGAIHQLI